MAETNIKVLKIEVDTGNGVLKVNGVEQSIRQATKAVKEFTETNKASNKALENKVNKTGLAGAALNELGRTISDSNYGLQGMANNLSQLSSLLSTLLFSTDGFKNGIKALGSALMGPVGIILIFQTFIAFLEKLDMKQKELQRSTNNIAKAFGSAAADLIVLKELVNDSTVSIEEKNRAISKANSQYKDLGLALDENNKLNQASIDIIDRKIEAMQREAKARAIIQEIEKEFGKIAALEAKSVGEYITAVDFTLFKARNFFGDTQEAVNKLEQTGIKNKEKAIKQSEDAIERLKNMIREEDLLDEIFKPNVTNKKTRDRVFKQIFLDLTKQEEKFRQESLKADLITAREKIEIDKQNAEREIELAYFVYLEKRQLKLDEFLESNATEAQKVAAVKKHAEEEIVALQQVTNVKNQIRAKEIADIELLNRRLAELSRKEYENVIEIQRKIELTRRQRSIQDIKEEIKLQEKLSEVAKEGSELQASHLLKLAQLKEELRIKEIQNNIEIANFTNEQLRVITDFADSEFQRRLDIEQNKTTALNNELREQLLNENLAKDERARIQNQIAQNDEKLRKKQEEIEKKRFYMQKAANIAMAIVDTYVAANNVLAQQPGGAISKTAAMIAVIAAGLLNVATIARQQFKASSASAAAGGRGIGGRGGSGDVQAPDFNIVGASPSNQLAAAVRGQFQQPVKAYVVSKDVSTAQEMDRNIIGSASLG